MKITSEGKELFLSQSYLTFGHKETTIELKDDQESIFIKIYFHHDKDKPTSLEYKSIDEHNLKVDLINWGNPIGVSSKDFIEVGTLFNRRLYFNILVRQLQDIDCIKELLFSAYLGEEVSNG